jgi:hypothetical protein
MAYCVNSAFHFSAAGPTVRVHGPRHEGPHHPGVGPSSSPSVYVDPAVGSVTPSAHVHSPGKELGRRGWRVRHGCNGPTQHQYGADVSVACVQVPPLVDGQHHIGRPHRMGGTTGEEHPFPFPKRHVALPRADSDQPVFGEELHPRWSSGWRWPESCQPHCLFPNPASTAPRLQAAEASIQKSRNEQSPRRAERHGNDQRCHPCSPCHHHAQRDKDVQSCPSAMFFCSVDPDPDSDFDFEAPTGRYTLSRVSGDRVRRRVGPRPFS